MNMIKFHSTLLSVLVRTLGAVVAISFARFLGSEGTAIHITGKLIILFGIILLGCIFQFRRYSSRMNKYVRLFFYISILFSIFIFYYFVRIYLFSSLGLFIFSNISFLILSMLPVGQALPGPSSPVPHSPSSEDSFAVGVLLEPWPVTPNLSMENSMQARIQVLENENSIFILFKEKGQYWSEIKAELTQCSFSNGV